MYNTEKQWIISFTVSVKTITSLAKWGPGGRGGGGGGGFNNQTGPILVHIHI